LREDTARLLSQDQQHPGIGLIMYLQCT